MNNYLKANKKLLFKKCAFGIKGKYSIIPSQIWMPLTNKCNLHCIMCEFTSPDYHNKTYYNEEPFFITLEEIRLIYDNDRFKNVFSNRPVEFCFTKGETFLNPHLYEILEWLKIEFPLSKVRIMSNGTVPPIHNGEIVKYIDNLIFSIDGATNTTFEKIRVPAKLDQVKSSIKNWYDAKLKYNSVTQFGFAVCLSSLNIYELPDIIKLAFDLCKVGFVYCQPIEIFDDSSELSQYKLNNIPISVIHSSLVKASEFSKELGVRMDLEKVLKSILEYPKYPDEEKLNIDYSLNKFCMQIWKPLIQIQKNGSLNLEFICCYLKDFNKLYNEYNIPTTGNIIDLMNSKEMWRLRKDFLKGKCLEYCNQCQHGQTGYYDLCNRLID